MINEDPGTGETAMINLKNLKPQYITNETGKKTAVILPIAQFQELMEDIEDLAAAAERHEEPATSHDEFVSGLKRDGIL